MISGHHHHRDVLETPLSRDNTGDNDTLDNEDDNDPLV